jgi:hypothetical protein
MDEDIYKPFTKIITFVKELNTLFGTKYSNISLYYKLLKKTPVSNKGAVRKQNLVFKTFLENNKDAIIEKDISLLKDSTISFSERVFINIKDVLEEADDNENIFKYLQLISALLIRDEKMIEALKDTTDNETKFLNKFMGKVESSFKGSEINDPIKAAMSLMGSGILSDMGKEIQSGKLNIGKLIGNLQGMMTDVVKDIKETNPDSNQEIEKINDTLTNLPNIMNNIMSGNGGQGDIMNMVSGLMGGNSATPSPDMMNMMNGLLGGGSSPDIMSMVSGMLGNGEQPDMMNMVNGLMSNLQISPVVEVEETTTEETQE